MESAGNIAEFLREKSVLVTGSTGFLAKIFVEKVLRVQPSVKKLFLLVRASDGCSVEERFQNEVIGKELFDVLREKHGKDFDSFISDKVSAVAGDISYENLGIKDYGVREQLWKEVDIVVNVAATTNFYERYDVALGINVMGAKNVLEFAKQCRKIKMLLHVSTGELYNNNKALNSPRTTSDGKPMKMTAMHVMKTMTDFKRYMFLRYRLPLEGFRLLNIACFCLFNKYVNKLWRKYRFVMLLAELYAPYAFFKGCFDDANLEKLRVKTRDSMEATLFDFDPKHIEWEDYFCNIHIPGVLKNVSN
ncbi:fatty acyl-CoA reductase 3-like [Phalaenopsis equestris]|uniref:fatty acyl-CoA reductase 3-like n=1 Tax=Phalaenopsis equestris TaxID=78828 RepID=UPI0009E38AC5|nr:fatty acyl-CoA reductase 3-like [Phalaenopsis equestris]